MLEDTAAATQRAIRMVTINDLYTAFVASTTGDDVDFYAGGATLPQGYTLGPQQEAVVVTIEVPVHHSFARIIGVEETIVTRRAAAIRNNGYSGGTPIAPMWVDESTDWQYGMSQDLHEWDGKKGNAGRVPGNFGWLEPETSRNDFIELLRGYNVDPALKEANSVSIGDIVEGLPGQRAGQWDKALGDWSEGRLDRATWEPWDVGTFENHRTDDPRLMIIPIVSYQGGSGSNAEFEVVDIGVWWLEEVEKKGNDKIVRGRFIDYYDPSNHTLDDYLGGGALLRLAE
jgi:hypothetical protein